ncbi:MAG: hypothetical protein NWQ59_00500, partial [Pseudoalteromonas tunicata]|nr:hypothetical protein [Pseudoalteromonas tunicata]
MPLIRLICMTLFCFALAACGGGGSLETTTGTTKDKFELSISINGIAPDQSEIVISKDNQGELVASLTKNGQPFGGQLITFTLAGSIGTLDPTNGTAQTATDGKAKIKL